MEKIFYDSIEKHNLINEHDHIIVGFSGGADSVSLLHLLKKLEDKYKISLTAIHIHHGLRGSEADSDAKFCADFCKSLSIPFIVKYFDVKNEAKKLKLTEEEAGRKIRYSAFYELLKQTGANKIAVAHNQNDQAETLLMRFFRGTGIKGLSGIKIKRDEIIRPLLYVERHDIEEYCEKNSLEYRIDLTNSDIKYTRNNIRSNLIPQIQDNYNKNIVSTLARTAVIINEENEFLDNMCQSILKDISVQKEKTLINIEKLKSQDIVLQRRIIRQAVMRYNSDLHDISLAHINIIIDLLQKGSGKEVNLPDKLKAAIEFNNLVLYKNDIPNLYIEYDLELEKEIYIAEKNIRLNISLINDIFYDNGCTKAFDYDKISNNLKLRNRQAGDKIFLSGTQSNKKLKDYFIDKKIPRDVRDTILLLADGKNILWIDGMFVSDLYKVTKDTNKVLYFHYI